MKLKYTLTLKDHTIYFQIHEQSVTRGFHITASNGIRIESDGCPELLGSYVFLRGNNTVRDNQIVSRTLRSKEIAESEYYKYKDALEEIFGKPSKWSIAFKYPRSTRSHSPKRAIGKSLCK